MIGSPSGIKNTGMNRPAMATMVARNAKYSRTTKRGWPLDKRYALMCATMAKIARKNTTKL